MLQKKKQNTKPKGKTSRNIYFQNVSCGKDIEKHFSFVYCVYKELSDAVWLLMLLYLGSQSLLLYSTLARTHIVITEYVLGIKR